MNKYCKSTRFIHSKLIYLTLLSKSELNFMEYLYGYLFTQIIKYRSEIKQYLPIGRCTNRLLLRSKDRRRARSPIRGGRFVISLQPASNSANAVILPNSSGNDTNLLCAINNVWSGSLHISRGSDVNWFRLWITIIFFLNRY